MAASDIYEIQDPPWAKKAAKSSRRRRARKSRRKSSDESVISNFSTIHRRRSRNRGFRRFRHLMKNAEFSKPFWIISVSLFGTVIGLLIIWDMFFRYPKERTEDPPPEAFRIKVE